MTLLSIMSKCSSQDNHYHGDDVRLFYNTPVWEAAKAIEKGDTIMAKKLLKNTPDSILNYKESKFGQSLLTWAAYSYHYSGVKMLAEMGANPNLKGNDSTSAFMYACGNGDSSAYLKILLKYGGDVNAVANNNIYHHYRTPLMAAIKAQRLEYVKILINAGADPNYRYISKGIYDCALGDAFTANNLDILSYLIFEVGIDCKKPTGFDREFSGDSIYITNDLRNKDFPLDSKEYVQKMEIIDYLNKQGIFYKNAPIPFGFQNKYDKEYLDKY
jgi:uncharacterized protein